jgi:hypothetical protein
MTPKEKAEELVSRYITAQNKWFMENLIDGLRISHAKQCALIAVDQVIDLGLLYGEAPFGNGGKQFYSYWQQVKIEIEKL